MTCLIWANALFCRNSMQRSRNYLDLILAASYSKLVEPTSRPQQNVCMGGEARSNQNKNEGRNRRRRLTARSAANCKRRRKTKARESDVIGRPLFPRRNSTIGDRGRPSKGRGVTVPGTRQSRQADLFLRKGSELFCVVPKMRLLVLRRGWRLTPNCAA